MGLYLNPMNTGYQETLDSKVFVDKSLLIEYTNSNIRTSQKYIYVLRPRRFWESTDANMLVAYYSKGCDSSNLFDKLKVSQIDSYQKHRNQHNVIHINMQEFLSDSSTIDGMLTRLSEEVIEELEEYSDMKDKRGVLSLDLSKIFVRKQEGFIFIIDEWDCIFREYREDKEAQRKYLDFLRNLLKDKPYVELAYMTGILPIKKYGTQSALNMFREISMIDSTPLEEFMGFTENEVKELCNEYHMDYDDMKEWYDGFR